MKMGKTKQLAMQMAEHRLNVQEFEKQQTENVQDFDQGKKNSSDFLRSSIVNIHKIYCAGQGIQSEG